MDSPLNADSFELSMTQWTKLEQSYKTLQIYEKQNGMTAASLSALEPK